MSAAAPGQRSAARGAAAPRRAWVTGSHGFVGGFLTRALRDAGWGVTAAWARSGSAPRPLPQAGDVVFHLAGIAHRPAVAGDHMAANCALTLDLYRRASAVGARGFVFASTSKVLGDASPTALGVRAPRRPHGAYAASKAAAEEALLAASREAALPLAIVRPPLVYGAGVKGNLRRLLWALARGLPLPLASARGQRSFVSGRNLASALAALGADPARSEGIWHVADGEDVNCATLCRRLARHLGRKARLVPAPPAVFAAALRLVPALAANADSLVASTFEPLRLDDSAFRHAFAWSPPQRLDDGLAELARWYRGAART